MPCYSPLKGYRDAETGGLRFKGGGSEDYLEVACGQCIGCRLDNSRMWAARIVHESSMPEHIHGNRFVTLTYRPEIECTKEQKAAKKHIPEDWSLSAPIRDSEGRQVESSDFQKFMKRLRKSRTGDKIKYFQCGEYGRICKHGLDLELVECPMCNHGRPHHHAILFNVAFPDIYQYDEKKGIPRYSSKELEDLWGFGFVDVGEVTFQSAAYTARYILKKVTGEKATDYYKSVDIYGEITNITPEYASMSNGLGKGWLEQYKEDCFPSDEVPVPGHGIIKKVPRYYEELVKTENPEMIEEIKERRQKFKAENAEEYTPDRLMSKYKVKKSQVETLGRQL